MENKDWPDPNEASSPEEQKEEFLDSSDVREEHDEGEIAEDEIEEEIDEAIGEEDENQDEEEIAFRYIPPWSLSPDQRITYKTIGGAIAVLTLFMTVLFWVNGPKASNRFCKNDLERDGLKGSVKSVEYWTNSMDPLFTFLSTKPSHFVFNYNEKGNRIREEYYDGVGKIANRVEFDNETGESMSSNQSGVKNNDAPENPDKQFGLFDPIDIRSLQSDPNISQTYFELNYDSGGNWDSRRYRIRRHSRLYESSPIGEELRKIEYYIQSSATGKPDGIFHFKAPVGGGAVQDATRA